MAAFDEVRFPDAIAYGSTGGPEYATDIVMLANGYEQRNVNWSAARARYNVARGVKTQAELDTLIAFFRARKGRAYGFRFKDHADYQATGQVIGAGDGATTVFQLVKTYQSGARTETRNITKPVDSTVNIYLDSVLQSSGVTVDAATGEVTFDSAPGGGVAIQADFEFDVPVRFDVDQLSVSLQDYGAFAVNPIPLVEVRV